ncbi:DUF4286 family protein [Sphingomonas sp.]|uniref:DUF4286 family protein n=1 Tax=Sphingomonas sp. TaxID=28214 RepID=UPI000DB35710|nr:DUF4286 family protein [Sphingomonas sp.]PZU10999.1 MAG: hypothetical protein DI605_05175 [Sphingomonas sp.]
MIDALFSRLPLGSDAENGDIQALMRDQGGGRRLVSAVPPAEVAIFSCDGEVAGHHLASPGAATYVLEQVSDTGAATEAPGALMLVAFNVPPDMTAEVDRWYDEEHIGLLMKADGWLRARRYRVLSHDGGPRWTSMAFHDLRDVSVMDSPERAFARSTAWRAELEKGAWFQAAGRGVFRPLR